MSIDQSSSVLPIEILSCIFEYTDTPSLLSICLVCHEFNEIAGPILYQSLLWDFNDSLSGSHFTVFKRRPQWRQFVRKIKFDYAWYMPPYNMDRYIADRAAKEASLLPWVHTLYLERCPHPLDPPWSEYYRKLFGSFVRLKKFHSYWHWGTLSEILPPSGLVEITLVGSHSTPSMNRWLQMHCETLESLILSLVSDPEVDFLGSFTALRRLSIPNIPNWPKFVTTLGAMGQLQDLSLTMEQARLEIQVVGVAPVALPRLRSLHMTIFDSFHFCNAPIRSIRHAYETLATSSRSLEALHISTQPRDHLPLYGGGKFTEMIVRNHGLTIRSVLLDEITLSPQNLLSLCSRCPNLYTLGFNVPKKASLVELSVALSFSVSLSNLRLTATDWTAPQMEEECSLLLIQGLAQLNSLLIRWGRSVRRTSRVGYTLWKTRWTYDQSINAPRRSLEMSTKNEAEWDLY